VKNKTENPLILGTGCAGPFVNPPDYKLAKIFEL
jgi:hypothetical protein